jgi:prepilin-type N-terminal cleavage/methylation domain-containing protein
MACREQFLTTPQLRKQRTRLSQNGFTLIEVVIAIAITAFIVLAVFAVTNSMTTVAKRQQEESLKTNHLSRFLEIFKQDVQGWSLTSSTVNSINPTPPTDTNSNTTVLLDISTTADGLSPILKDSTFTRSAKIQYVCRNYLRGYELVRTEISGLGSLLELSLLKLTQPALIEFFDGTKWSKDPPQNHLRPKLLRLTVDDATFSIRL